MKLALTSEWLRRKIADGPEEPGGLMACSPELYEEMMERSRMTSLVEDALADAEDAVAKAFSIMGNAGPGGHNLWPGAWGEYRKLGKLLCRLRTLHKRATAWNNRFNRGKP